LTDRSRLAGQRSWRLCVRPRDTWPHVGDDLQQRHALAPLDQHVGFATATIRAAFEAQGRPKLDPSSATQARHKVGMLGAQASHNPTWSDDAHKVTV
jgi:hypothetical protein